jgi:hypothetical protein
MYSLVVLLQAVQTQDVCAVPALFHSLLYLRSSSRVALSLIDFQAALVSAGCSRKDLQLRPNMSLRLLALDQRVRRAGNESCQGVLEASEYLACYLAGIGLGGGCACSASYFAYGSLNRGVEIVELAPALEGNSF